MAEQRADHAAADAASGPQTRGRRLLARLRPLALNVALVAASFGFAALLAEGLVRLVAPQQLILIRPDLWQPADTFGWLHRPGVDVEMNTGERTVRVLTDAEGFRVGPDGPVEADRQVLLLGDSFMEALQVEYEESAAGRLERGLATAVGSPVAVRNAGIGGWDPDQYVLRARSLLTRSDYDLVVTALYLGNDVIARRREHLPPRTPVERASFRLPRGLSWGELTSALLLPVNDVLEVRSHLYLFFKNRLQTVRMEVGLAAVSFPVEFTVAEADSERWRLTAELCAEIDALARAHGAESLFVMIPTPFQVDSLDLVRYVQGFDLDRSTIDLEQPNRLLGAELEARGLRVYDLLPEFRAVHDRGEQLFGAVDPHFTPRGNELFVDLVLPRVAELLSGGDDGSGPPSPEP